MKGERAVKKPSVVVVLLLLTSASFYAQSGFTGSWWAELFPMVTINLATDGTRLTGTISRGARPVDISEGEVNGTTVTFKVIAPDGDRTIHFRGTLNGDEIVFLRDVQVSPGSNPGGPGIFGAAGPQMFTAKRINEQTGPPSPLADGEQLADPDFDANVANPAFTNTHPRLLFDEAHFNYHTSGGRYKPFVDLVTNDGYRVTANKARFETAALAGYQILVIANAHGAEQVDDPRAARPAFTDEECDLVRNWVQAGGALLLIADHFPSGSAASNLAKQFGIDMSNSYTVDESNYEKSRNTGTLVFSEDNKLLGNHTIIRGRRETERVRRVTTFVGQSLKGPDGSTALLKLADTAMDRSDQKSVSAAGRAQAVALRFGKGRVVAFGEAASLTAQVTVRGKSGMSFPGSDNRQLVLNIMHWLSNLME
jgi:hypothetical protein